METRDPTTAFKFECIDGLIYRTCVKSKLNDQTGRRSLVVTSEYHKLVLSLAHESPLAGNFSHRNTGIRVQEHFYWPGISVDIKHFCKSCDLCQRMSVKGKGPLVSLVKMPIVTSIYPYFDRSCNQFPRSLVAQRNIFRLGSKNYAFRMKNVSDRGMQFTSQLMSELHKLLGVKPLFTTPYYPSCNWKIECSYPYCSQQLPFWLLLNFMFPFIVFFSYLIGRRSLGCWLWSGYSQAKGNVERRGDLFVKYKI